MCIHSFQILSPFRLLQNPEQSSGHHPVMWTHLGQPERAEPLPHLLQRRAGERPVGHCLCLRKGQLTVLHSQQPGGFCPQGKARLPTLARGREGAATASSLNTQALPSHLSHPKGKGRMLLSLQ